MSAALYTLGYLYAFWLAYIGVMGIYRAQLTKRLSPTTLTLLFPFVLLGLLMDVAANIVIAPVLFLDPPREWLVTSRLIRYLKTDTGWRNKLAGAVCENLLDVFDPTGKHCA